MSLTQGEWLPLMDYAVKKGVSLSTLRRHIKAKKILFRVEHGKYLVFDDGDETAARPASPTAPAGASWRDFAAPTANNPGETRELRAKLSRLEHDLLKAQREITELKTLIAFYEEQMSPKKNFRS
jgi:hypothetical protein